MSLILLIILVLLLIGALPTWPYSSRGGRLNIRYKPMENWTIDFIGYRQNTSVGDLSNLNPSYIDAANNKWAAASMVKQPYTDQYQAYNLISVTRMNWATLTATASWQERKMTYTHDTSYNYTNSNCSGADADFLACYPLSTYQANLAAGKINAVQDNQAVNAWTAEVRLSAPAHSKIKWTGGVFYQMRQNKFGLNYGAVDPYGYFNRDSDGWAPTSVLARANWDNTRQIAEFGELTYPITKKLKITGGVRGLARPLHVEAESGTLLCCALPAAVMGRISTCQRVVDVIMAALAPVCPESITAAANGCVGSATFSGTRKGSNKFWIYLETIGGGAGARHNKDGLDGVQVHLTNTSNLPIEALETEYPLTLLRYELVEGSAVISHVMTMSSGLSGKPNRCGVKSVSSSIMQEDQVAVQRRGQTQNLKPG